MIPRVGSRTVALLLLTPFALGFAGSTRPLVLQPESRLWIDGKSTVRDFQCRAGEIRAKVEANGGNPAGDVLGGTKAVTTVEVRVPVEQLACGNGTMDDHMYKALKGDQHREILFRVQSYELGERSATGMPVTMAGELTLGGVKKPITVRGEARDASGALQVTGSHEVRMTEFDLRPPSLMMGTMKVNERVRVGFDLVLKP